MKLDGKDDGRARRFATRLRPSVGGRIEELTQHFDRQAFTYDGPLLRYLGNAEFAAVEKLLPEPCDALDFGCGAGRFSLLLASRGYRVTGYDVSPNMVARATERSARVGIGARFTADPRALDGGTWPLVICMGVMDYYRDPSMLLRQVAPCVAPGGRLIVGAPNLFGPLSWAHALLFVFSVRMYLFRASDIAEAGKPLGLTAFRTSYALPAVTRMGMSVLVAFDKRDEALVADGREDGSRLRSGVGRATIEDDFTASAQDPPGAS